MPPPTKEPCKQQACNIQSCLVKNNFITEKCLDAVEKLQSCCEKCSYKSTHCASVAGLLAISKRKPA